jgi:flavin-dependent dehydrogenase
LHFIGAGAGAKCPEGYGPVNAVRSNRFCRLPDPSRARYIRHWQSFIAGKDMGERFDAVVIGGGPAGSTAAILLAGAGWSVALVERKTFPRRKVCGEYLSASNWPLLERLGVAREFERRAGPAVRRVAVFAGEHVISAPLPAVGNQWGRALGRETLDAALIDRARDAGARVFQPVAVRRFIDDGQGFRCSLSDGGTLASRLVIAAHGYWEPGPLPTQPVTTSARPDQLLAFKAHFRNSRVPNDTMPLIAFPGGYGGLVQSDDGRVTFSCCVRRDRLAALRPRGEIEAGQVVFRHVLASCRGAREALGSAVRDGPWLSAGPLRPGVRVRANRGVFAVGNAAGEVHPVVAEGISMALQSAWLLTRQLIARGPKHRDWHAVGVEYARAWRRAFGLRLAAASLIANWAMRPVLTGPSLPVVHAFPAILSLAATLSGKVSRIVR